MFANLLKMLGLNAASSQSHACIMVFLDEPECPKSLIK